jgi:hypothetical protein
MVIGVELVGFRLLRDGLHDGGVELVADQRGREVELAMTPKAGTEFSVGGESELVARRAEILLGECANKTDARAGQVSAFMISGRTVACA